MFVISFKKYDGLANMSIDENILDSCIKNQYKKPVLRFYGWSNPTLTIGRNQSLKTLNLEYCKKNNIDIIKRPTGGRAILHDEELTYSFVVPANFLQNGESVLSSYKEISEALIMGFKKLNIELDYSEHKKICVKDDYCMSLSTGADLNFSGKKLIGSAQFRKHGYILQHGSILIDIDKDKLSNIFHLENNDQNFTTIKAINPELADIDLLCNDLKDGFQEKFT